MIGRIYLTVTSVKIMELSLTLVCQDHILRTVLITTILCIVSYSPCKGGCIQPSCDMKMDFSASCTFCSEQSAVLLRPNHLAYDPEISKSVSHYVTLRKYSVIWLDKSASVCAEDVPDPCQAPVYTDNLVENKSCSEHHFFLCYHALSNDSRCGKCLHPSVQTVSSTTQRASSTNTSIQPSKRDSFNIIIPISICVTVSLVLIITVVACCLCRRQRKPAKYAVREASALYHRQNSDVETETGNGPQRMQLDEHAMMGNSAYSVCVVSPPRPEVPNDIQAKPENYDILGRQEKHYYSALSPRSCDETKLKENMS